jgi:hypothetical protein
MQSMSVRFARVAQAIAVATRAAGLVVPAFRSPPRNPQALRTLRRLPTGHVVVAVRVRDRSQNDIINDLVDGVCVVNGLIGPAQLRIRQVLVAAAQAASPDRTDTPSDRGVASGPSARMAERQTQAA